MVQRVSDPEPQKAVPEDVFSKLLGHFGKWQLVIFLSVFLIKLSSGWVQMAILFLTPKVTFWCDQVPENFSQIIINGTCYDKCLKYAYDNAPFHNTIISEWDLICGNSWMASFTQMMLQLGVLIGSIVFGFLSDRYGRKNTFLTSIAGLISFGFCVPYSPSYVIFTISRFFLGFSVAGTMVISFVIVMESVGPKYREAFGCIFHIPFIIGHLTISIFAYFFRSWDQYCLSLAIPQLIFLSYFFILSESPRWLVSVGRVEEAAEIVKKAAEINNMPTEKIEETLKKFSHEIASAGPKVNYSDLFRPSLRLRTLCNCVIWVVTGTTFYGVNQYIGQTSSNAFVSVSAAAAIQIASQTGPKVNYSDLFRPSLRLRTLCNCVIWVVTGTTFYGVNQYIGQTSANAFVSVSAAAAIQLPSNIFSIWCVKTFGRKATTVTSYALGGLCILTLGVVGDNFWIVFTLGTLGVSFLAINAATIYIYSSELYPTVVRNMGMGICSMSLRIGSMIAPFVSNSGVSVPWLPTVFFGLSPLLGAAVCLLLPETKGRKLPDSFEDVEEKPAE